jgi:hypothetical protein
VRKYGGETVAGKRGGVGWEEAWGGGGLREKDTCPPLSSLLNGHGSGCPVIPGWMPVIPVGIAVRAREGRLYWPMAWYDRPELLSRPV